MSSKLSYWHTPLKAPYRYTTICDFVKERSEVHPDYVPFTERSPNGDKQEITNKEFYNSSVKIAKYLVSEGVGRHDKVAIYGPNSMAWIVGECAIVFAGAAAVHINIHTKDASDAVEILDLAACRMLLIDPAENQGAHELISKFQRRGTDNKIMLLRKNDAYDIHDLESELANSDSGNTTLPFVSPDDDVYIQTTSGSTGAPKMVVHTHYGLTCSIPPDEELASRPNMKIYNDRPFSWAGGSPFLSYLHKFSILFTVVPGSQSLEESTRKWSIIKEEGCNAGYFMPHVLQDLIRNKDTMVDDGFRLMTMITGGEVMDSQCAEVLGRFCHSLVIGYGFTENGASVAMNVLLAGQNTYSTGDVGTVVPGPEVRIVDDQEDPVALGMAGEVQLRQKSLFRGYLQNEKMTKEVFTSNGWFRTGDIGVLNEGGKLNIKRRKKEVISRAGRKIIPAFVEDQIMKMPGLSQVAVVGVPDERLFEEVCACFVPLPGEDVSPESVDKFCRDTLLEKGAGDGLGELPKYYLRFQEFPFLHTGKRNKKELKTLAMRRLNLG